MHVARIATEFRQHFKRDIVIDMFCYRRHGHNESDEPAFTQPLMYKEIGGHKTTQEVYAARLEAEGVVTAGGRRRRWTPSCARKLDKALEAATNYKPNKADWLEGNWSGIDDRAGRGGSQGHHRRRHRDAAGRSAARSPSRPRTSTLNRKIARQLQEKRKAIDTGKGIDWATGEALAFGTLLAEGTPVRLSRPGFGARHLLAAPRGADRPEQRERVHPAQSTSADGQAQLRGDRQPADRGGRARLRIRLFARPSPMRWCCGKRSSATSPTARRSSSTSSSARAKASGCACPAS